MLSDESTKNTGSPSLATIVYKQIWDGRGCDKTSFDRMRLDGCTTLVVINKIKESFRTFLVDTMKLHLSSLTKLTLKWKLNTFQQRLSWDNIILSMRDTCSTLKHKLSAPNTLIEHFSGFSLQETFHDAGKQLINYLVLE